MGYIRLIGLCAGSFALLLALTSCSSNQDTPNDPDSPSVPIADYKALVVGEADSPFLTVLGKEIKFEQDNASAGVSDYDLVIFDGDAHAPGELVGHKRLAEAVDAGVWVMIADASQDHKRQVVLPHLGLAGQTATPAVLFRKNVDAMMPTFDVMEMPPLTAEEMTAQQEPCCTLAQSHQYTAFVGRMKAKLKVGSCAAPLDIQAGIIYATWCYNRSVDTATSGVQVNNRQINEGNKVNGKVVQMQTGLNDANYSFTLLLNNADVVTGDSQTLHVEVAGQMTPTTTTWPSGSGSDTGKPYFLGDWWAKKYDDSSFLGAGRQASLEITMGPTTEGVLQSAANFAPQTPNNTETVSYSSSTTFSISATLNAALVPLPTGGSGGGGGGSITGTYSTTSTNTRSYSVPDWTWVADLSGQDTYSWRFDSHKPEVGSYVKGKEWSAGWAIGDYNELNENLMAYSASAIWTTDDVSSETVDFEVDASQYTADVYAEAIAIALDGVLADFREASASDSVSIDLGTIIPVTLDSKSLTFADSQGTPVTQQNPVKAGEDVTATVRLSGAAPFAYNISADADSTNDNATITESPVGIAQGDTNKTFIIETNDNALRVWPDCGGPYYAGKLWHRSIKSALDSFKSAELIALVGSAGRYGFC